MGVTNDLVIASDGLLARESGPWAEEKLNHVSRYMDLVTTGMRRKWPRLLFVDLMAGPGLCVDRDTRREFSGSPLLALGTKYPFTEVLCIEADPTAAGPLQARVAQSPRAASALVLNADSNAKATIDEVRRRTTNGLSFVFVDLIGQEIAFETLAAITEKRTMDLMISFPEMSLQRNVWLAPADAREGERWSRFFGTEEWRQVLATPQRPAAALRQLRQLYERQLATLGYLTRVNRLPMMNRRKRAIYRPMFAARHQRGIDFYAKSLPVSRQADLFL